MWVSQQYYDVRITLILIWVGFMAIFRGIAEIVMAFELHHAKKSRDVARLSRRPDPIARGRRGALRSRRPRAAPTTSRRAMRGDPAPLTGVTWILEAGSAEALIGEVVPEAAVVSARFGDDGTVTRVRRLQQLQRAPTPSPKTAGSRSTPAPRPRWHATSR